MKSLFFVSGSPTEIVFCDPSIIVLCFSYRQILETGLLSLCVCAGKLPKQMGAGAV